MIVDERNRQEKQESPSVSLRRNNVGTICPAKIDWDKVRVEAAIAAMNGLCSSCHDSVIREIQESSDKERSNVISYLAVRMADSLVRELRKEETI